MTGIEGRYDVTLETSMDPTRPAPSVFDAVEKLGLKLDLRRVNLDILIDKIAKMPSAN